MKRTNIYTYVKRRKYGRQFGWGDSLLKCNKGLQR